MSAPSRWLVTGCSDGLGRSIVEAALTAGHAVIATARDVATLDRFGDRVTALPLDVTMPADIRTVAAAAEAAGGVDVLVNNAGHGYLAALEEGEDEKIRRTFEVNVFGPAALIRAILPSMRRRRSGCVVNISSVAGFIGGPGSAYYVASKFALEGLSDSLSAETSGFGIRTLVVEPGPIRTSFAGRSILRSPSIADYAEVAGARQNTILRADGAQEGDPDAIARLVVEAVDGGSAVSRLVIGAAAIRGVESKLAAVAVDLETMREASLRTDFPGASAA